MGFEFYLIKFAPKLRRLRLSVFYLRPSIAAEVLSILETILFNRNNGNIGGVFIEIMLGSQYAVNIFSKINGCNDSIKLRLSERKRVF